LNKHIEMEKPTSYCEAISRMEKDNVHVIYHNTAYGFPIDDDNELFGRLILEINQAGLSWTTILNKQENFRKAYSSFHIETIATYTEVDRARLLNDAGIIRNRLKINAAIHNAKVIVALKTQHHTFKNWLNAHAHFNKQEWITLFKKTFNFTGGEIVNEFLMSTGYLPGAHIESCEIYKKLRG